jgi:hypothetical protein
MTKAELLAALEPFTDEIEIAIGENGGFSEITGHAYGLSKDGDGWLILDRGGRVELPRVVRPRMETGLLRDASGEPINPHRYVPHVLPGAPKDRCHECGHPETNALHSTNR